MLTGLPLYVIVTFLFAVVLTWLFFINAIKNKTIPAIVITIWLIVTAALAYKGVFTDTKGMPPKFTLAVAPAFLFIIALIVTKKGQAFIDGLDLKKLTLLHIVRIPVEITLYWLAANKAIPELMTFAGRNFDIISGITAPVIWLVCFSVGQVKNKKLLLVWNFVCLGLLLNIVITAVLSVPFSIQQFAFDQPNIAVLYFPFVWLPSFIVMIVLLSHLTAIRRLLKK